MGGTAFADAVYSAGSLWARIASSVTMSDSSSLYRVSIYTAALDIIRHYWVTGIGIGAFNQIYPLFSFEAANAYHAHNLFLQEFIELGIVGFAVLVLLSFVLLPEALQRYADGTEAVPFSAGGNLRRLCRAFIAGADGSPLV